MLWIITKLENCMLTGLEFLEPTINALKLEEIDNLQITYAITVAQQYHPPLETGRSALVTHLQGQNLATRVKGTLLNAYADNHPINLVQAAGSETERVWTCPLSELDRQTGLDESTTIFLPAQASDSGFSSTRHIGERSAD